MAEKAYYTYYINSAGEWVEPLSAVEFIFVNPAWVCLRNSHLQKGVASATGQLFIRGKIKNNCLVLFRALKAAHLCHSKSHLDANRSPQVEGFNPQSPHRVYLETGTFAAGGRCDKGTCVGCLH